MTDTVRSTLSIGAVQNLLDRLHRLADDHDEAIGQQVRSNPVWLTASSDEKATLLRDALLPVSPEAGRFLYLLARSTSAQRIVEFGTSFGVSTIYFAAALRDNGGGRVIGSELEEGKVAKATAHLAEAALLDLVDLRAGDALLTLQDPGGDVDILFLDGWKELYLDVLHLLSSRLRPGAIVLADDVAIFPDQLAPYLDYVRDPANGFASVMVPLGDGIEYSLKL